MQAGAVVLVVDDDPSHLKIYGWVVESGGYRSVIALARKESLDLPEDPIDVVLLDYHLAGQITAVQALHLIKAKYKNAPVVVLSDAYALPDDIAPLADGFVRKGNPAVLLETLAKL